MSGAGPSARRGGARWRAAAFGRMAATTMLAAALLPPVARAADEDPAKFLEFVREDASNCVIRNGQRILVRSTHPSRTLRVWLDRYLMGIGTGDRSRSELKPGAEPEPLGCSRVQNGEQEWRVVRVQFVD